MWELQKLRVFSADSLRNKREMEREIVSLTNSEHSHYASKCLNCNIGIWLKIADVYKVCPFFQQTLMLFRHLVVAGLISPQNNLEKNLKFCHVHSSKTANADSMKPNAKHIPETGSLFQN